MFENDIGKSVEVFIKRMDGRVFCLYGKLISEDEIFIRVKTEQNDETLLKTDIQRLKLRN